MLLWEWFAVAVVVIQALAGAAEMFNPPWVFHRVLPNYRLPRYHEPSADLVWAETGKLARNMGLYNWFLALGLLLSLSGRLGGAPTSQFFLLCVAVAGAFGLLSVSRSWPFALGFILQLGFGLLTIVSFLQKS
jgi:uncharacterized membrane protein